MTDEQLSRLQAMCEPGQQTWDLSPKDEAAIRAAVAQAGIVADLVRVANGVRMLGLNINNMRLDPVNFRRILEGLATAAEAAVARAEGRKP
jgi:hypothetical protein